jgi:hypothetical protein
MKPHRLPVAGAQFLIGALVLAHGALAAPILPPLYRSGVNLGTNGCQVAQGITFWKDIIHVGSEAQTCYPNQPKSSATVFGVDASDPANLLYLTKSSFGGCKAYGLAVFEDKLYVANWSELLRTFDVCSGTQMNPLGIFHVPGDAGWELSVQDDRVYLAEGHELAESFYIIDVSNPASPRLVSATDWAGSPAVAGPYSFYGLGTSFNVLNISDETAPVHAAGMDLGVNVYDPKLRGDLAFAAFNSGSWNQGTSGIVCLDISEPLAPRQLGRWSVPDFHYWGGLFLLGDYAFLPTGGNGVYAVNIANPASMFSVSQFEVPYYALEGCVTGNGRHIYAGTVEGERTGGIHCWQFFTQDPDDAPPGNWKNFSPRATSWDLQYDAEALPTSAAPAWKLHEGTAVWAGVSNGVLRINDTGTAWGDKVKWVRRWNATSSRGATVMVRSRCASSNTDGAFIPNLVIEDGKYVEEFALLADRIQASHSGLEYLLNGTQWHTFRIITWSNRFKVYVDEAATPAMTGPLSVTTPHSRVIFGSGSSPARQDIYFDYVYAFSGGDRTPAETTNDTTPNVRVDASDLPGKNSLSGLVTNTARVHWSSDGGTSWQSSGGVLWNGQYEAAALPSASAPAWHAVEGSGSIATVSGGVLRILDNSTAGNTKVKFERLWRASPATGATVLARVRCASAGGDTTYSANLFVEDGQHSESFKILPDRIVAREAGLTYWLTGTSFHVYRITIKGSQFRVYLDEGPAPVMTGPLATPTSDNRVMFGSGASAGTQDVYFDFVRYCATADLPPGQGDRDGAVPVAVTLTGCAARIIDRCTLSAQEVPFHRYSETLNRLRFSIQDVEGNVGWSPIFNMRIVMRDTDADDIDDDWERNWFGGLAQNASTDFDADGAGDLHEFRAGTDPRDPASRFRLLGIETSPSNRLEIRWTAVPGKTYHVQASLNAIDASWTDVPSGHVIAGAGTAVWNGNEPLEAPQFYRVLVDY